MKLQAKVFERVAGTLEDSIAFLELTSTALPFSECISHLSHYGILVDVGKTLLADFQVDFDAVQSSVKLVLDCSRYKPVFRAPPMVTRAKYIVPSFISRAISR